jgi:Helix-turn-helix domain
VRAERPSRGRPEFADSQREKILRLLKRAGRSGVRREDLIFHYRWTQAGSRIFELEKMGYKIRHESRPGERLIVYVLASEPLEPKPFQVWKPEKSGYRHKSGASGEQSLASENVQNRSRDGLLPLFDTVKR